MAKIKDLPLEERPREKALLYGINTLSNSELLALIIGAGSKKESALEISNNLLAHSGSVQNLKFLTLDDLVSIPGISKAKALSILAAFTLSSRTNVCPPKIKVDREYLVNYFRKVYENERQEKSYLVLVDNRDNLLYNNVLFIGSENTLNISSRLVLSYILKYDAKKFYLIHNHPLGNPHPSQADLDTTHAIDFVSLSVACILVDHLVFGKDSYCSIIEEKEYPY